MHFLCLTPRDHFALFCRNWPNLYLAQRYHYQWLRGLEHPLKSSGSITVKQWLTVNRSYTNRLSLHGVVLSESVKQDFNVSEVVIKVSI